jgi:hypothetical protein
MSRVAGGSLSRVGTCIYTPQSWSFSEGPSQDKGDSYTPGHSFCFMGDGTNDLGISKQRPTSRHRLMSVHQLIELLQLTRLTVMSAINSVSSDHARDW